MRRRMLPAFFALLAILVLALPAQAGVQWCQSDPIVTLDGTRYQILVAVPEEYVPWVNGPIDVEVMTPEQTVYELVFTDAGFNGHGEVVRFTGLDPDNQYRFRITVPIDESALADGVQVPVQVLVIVENDDPLVIEGTSDGITVTIATTTTATDAEED